MFFNDGFAGGWSDLVDDCHKTSLWIANFSAGLSHLDDMKNGDAGFARAHEKTRQGVDGWIDSNEGKDAFGVFLLGVNNDEDAFGKGRRMGCHSGKLAEGGGNGGHG